jgi:nitrogen fixation NifU-like protein
MSDLRDLYQEVILDHNKRPRNYGPLADANRVAHGHNPLCGDKLRIHVRLDGDTIADIRFEGTGCAISKASASLMTESVKGQSVREADALFEGFHQLLTAGPAAFEPGRAAEAASLGKLAVFTGVSEFPMRVKCATLAWHTLKAALHQPDAVATTE